MTTVSKSTKTKLPDNCRSVRNAVTGERKVCSVKLPKVAKEDLIENQLYVYEFTNGSTMTIIYKIEQYGKFEGAFYGPIELEGE